MNIKELIKQGIIENPVVPGFARLITGNQTCKGFFRFDADGNAVNAVLVDHADKVRYLYTKEGEIPQTAGKGWNDYKDITLDLEQDVMEKAEGIAKEIPYDKRILIEINKEAYDVLLAQATEKGISVDDWAEHVIKHAIENMPPQNTETMTP